MHLVCTLLIQYGMKFSIENEIFIPGSSLAAEKQGLGLKFSIENEIFKLRIKISSENENFVRGGMVFFMRSSENDFFRSPGPLGPVARNPRICNVAFRDSGEFFQQFSRGFPGVFLENPRTDPGNSHSLLELSDFRKGDEDSNFSVFRVRRFTEWPGPLH